MCSADAGQASEVPPTAPNPTDKVQIGPLDV